MEANDRSQRSNRRRAQTWVWVTIVVFTAGSVATLVAPALVQAKEADSVDPAESGIGVYDVVSDPNSETNDVFQIAWSNSREEFVYVKPDFDSYRPSLVLYYSPKSEECRKLEENVLKDLSILSLTNGWHFIRVNFDKKGQIARQEGVRKVPTVTVHDSYGHEVFRQEGATTARAFHAVLSRLNLQVRTKEEVRGFGMASGTVQTFLLLFLIVSALVSVLALVLLAHRRDYTTLVLCFLVFGGLFVHALIAYTCADVFSETRHSVYSFTIPHLVLLPVAVMLIALNTAVHKHGLFILAVLCVLALLPSWWEAVSRWPGGDDGPGMGWVYGIGPATLANIVIGLPLAFLAHVSRK